MTLPEHVQWLVANRGPALMGRLAGQGVEGVIEDVLGVLVDADPSPGLHAVQWLCDTLIGAGMLWEDVSGGASSKAAETLGWFAQHRRTLPRGQRNLEDHTSLASLYRVLQPHLADDSVLEEPSGRALRRAEREQAWRQSSILASRDDLVVAVPGSELAAAWWGRGTRWCTAAREHNMFDHYNRDAPLVVVLLQSIPCNGEMLQAGKLQLWVGKGGGLQFMDSADDWVRPEYVWQHWDRLGGIVNWALEHSHRMLEYVPPHLRTQAMYYRAVCADGTLLAGVPLQWVDHDMCMAAVASSAAAIAWVSPDLLDEDICMAAVQRSPEAFYYVPPTLQTSQVCKAVIARSGRMLSYMTDPTPELCMLAVQTDGLALVHVPPMLLSQEIVLAAMTQNSDVIKNLPREYRTPELFLQAVKTNINSIKLVPQSMQTSEMAELVAKSKPELARFLRHDLVSSAMWMRAVQVDGLILDVVPSTRCTAELCRAAIAQNAHAFAHVPVALKTEDIMLQVLGINGMMLGSIARTSRTPRVCMAALTQNPKALQHVPKELRTAELCWIAVDNLPPYKPAVDKNKIILAELDSIIDEIPELHRTRAVYEACVRAKPRTLEHMPDEHIDAALCDIATSLDPMALRYVPRHLQTPAMALQCVERNPLALVHVIPENQTPQVCLAAVLGNPQALMYVASGARTPELYRTALEQDPANTRFMPLQWRVQMGHEAGVAPPSTRAWSPDLLEGLLGHMDTHAALVASRDGLESRLPLDQVAASSTGPAGGQP